MIFNAYSNGGGNYGAFQSKDPIISMEKSCMNLKQSGDGHDMGVDHPTS